MKAESLPSPIFTEEEVAAARNRLLHTLHWEAVRQDLLEEPKTPPHFKPGIEK